jgi:hypothetical protein
MLTIVNKKTWQTCDLLVWERVKHIVPVYNAHTLIKQSIQRKENSILRPIVLQINENTTF